MVKKIITWVDLEGRYRVTSPAYNDSARPPGETEDECIARVVAKIKIHYGLPDSHTFHFVEDADQKTRIAECGGQHFRCTGMPDEAGHHDARGGAWEMDTDGRPKINMPKARVVHMDKIRQARNAKLVNLDIPFMRAVESGSTADQLEIKTKKQVLRDIPANFVLSGYTTPNTLKAAWPTELSD